MYGIYVNNSTASKARVILFFQKLRAKHIDNMHRIMENTVSLAGELSFIVFKLNEIGMLKGGHKGVFSHLTCILISKTQIS